MKWGGVMAAQGIMFGHDAQEGSEAIVEIKKLKRRPIVTGALRVPRNEVFWG